MKKHENVLRYFRVLFEYIEKSVAKGENVLIHCLAGRHRAGALGVAWLIYDIMHKNKGNYPAEKEGPYDLALKIARKRRPVIDIGDKDLKENAELFPSILKTLVEALAEPGAYDRVVEKYSYNKDSIAIVEAGKPEDVDSEFEDDRKPVEEWSKGEIQTWMKDDVQGATDEDLKLLEEFDGERLVNELNELKKLGLTKETMNAIKDLFE
jgi:hypothetical protein